MDIEADFGLKEIKLSEEVLAAAEAIVNAARKYSLDNSASMNLVEAIVNLGGKAFDQGYSQALIDMETVMQNKEQKEAENDPKL